MIRHLCVVVASFLQASVLHAQSTAFTYQGELKTSGTLASGMHDFRFRLFDAASGGAAVGSQLCADNIQVAEGRFTAPLDFGQAFVSTAPRFLEIEVRRDTGLNCANAGGFVVLSPRQAIAPAPRATSASVANALGSPNGTISNAVIVDNSGNVGIGTTTPGHSVTIAKPAPTLALLDTDSAGTAGGQQVGYISYRDSSNVERGWIGYGSSGDPDLSIINARPSGDIILNTFGGGNVGVGTVSPLGTLDVRGIGLFSGSVGIGTTTPSSRLTVRGNIQLGTNAEFFVPASEENLRIVRGNVSAQGDVLQGSGWTATRIATGTYEITFNTPFASVPTVTATSTALFVAGVYSQSATGFGVNISQSESSFNFPFQFIAVGPR